ncbi:sulfatase-like hydrolase/transferase [Methylosinus sp. Sm6]|uniref:sulfatase-like hydrolase/transferase n=1 Tax=Methylosinus sp. Sm6 TaxID=2866948 RepID=UPI001C990542|nr:sulfatase-like hydrolase/transferase [Methylosinus sp. Sm6]MBY6241636.1 sulfatase-like hydrolase/transferase [Methylosinus sp. Sm6]
MTARFAKTSAISAFVSAALGLLGAATTAEPARAAPNILFVVLDDVGIDQLSIFGYGGATPPKTPNMAKIAAAGVRFSNVWSMPQCSSSRSTYFTGRLPPRTGVGLAIQENHLPQTYVSSYETTLPRLLETAGYKSALVGKYHLGSERDPAGDCAPASRGFDSFAGNMRSGPPSIDLTAGNVDPTGGQVCGYYQGRAAGACYTQSSSGLSCRYIRSDQTDSQTSPARACLQRGGIFTPGKNCGADTPAASDFDRFNAYYVWPRTAFSGKRSPTLSSCDVGSTVDRTYLTVAQQNDGVSWWKSQTGPRMLTLSFNAIHAPLQKPPTTLVPDPDNAPSTCNAMVPDRNLLNLAIESLDTAIGRTLAQMGLAQLAADGRTIAQLNLGDTLVAIIGDNGSFGPTVRATDGFDAGRSKGTTYQTGVWVPLIVAGAQVVQPGRVVDALINTADLYGLFAAVAGLDAAKMTPPSHRLDSIPMRAYLTDPTATPTRQINYTEINSGTFTPDLAERSWPCVIGSQCSDVLFPTEGFCKDNGGVWYGPGAATQYSSCCAVAAANPSAGVTPMAVRQRAARDIRWKLVRSEKMNCSKPLAGSGQQPVVPWAEYATQSKDEFYDLKKVAGANPAGMDYAANDKLASCAAADPATCLPSNLRSTYRKLAAEIDRIADETSEEAACRAKGDGNLDMRINRQDIAGWNAFAGKGPSRYDINVDGETDEDDLAIIRANLGHTCMSVCRRADLNRNGKVGEADLALLRAQFGPCKDTLCGGDLDGDGRVGASDEVKMLKVIGICGGGARSAAIGH